VSLWVETLDPDLPFSFLDHKIKVGNALVGCWLDRVEDYPLKAWEREGGDGKNGERTGRIETFLKGEKVGNRRSGDGMIKREMRQIIEGRFTGQPPLFPEMQVTTETVIAQARVEYEALHALPPHTDPDERERIYREHVLGSPAVRRLRRAMDEWCAIWFWPTDEESLRHVPTPLTFHAVPSEGRSSVISSLASDLKFFHWELEFPDVFTPERSGFDGLIGNPPWEVMKPNSQEFFSDSDPLYRTYDKQRALRKQEELFGSVPGLVDVWEEYNARFKALSNWARNAADPFDLTLARGKDGSALASAWARRRKQRAGFADPEHPYRLQGSADLNLYKLFIEAGYFLLTQSGRLGVVVPSGLYSDSGSKNLREAFLERSSWEWLFGFENKKKIFDIHSSFKFAPTIVARQRATISKSESHVRAAFMVHNLADWERSHPPVFSFDRSLIPMFSPRSMSLPEVRTQRDLHICRKIFNGPTAG
jgi:hypothetical protein